ncbi:MAG: GAF domain-containing protein [Deltaproteobacteria bacterium]|nr:GAF domain-containing protein [Deltaproteobacteria bacterium]
MPTFEVHIPAGDASGFNVTLKVSAENWMAALKAGMQKLGEQGASTANVMVDMQDDGSIHITEATSGRVFRIRELNLEEVAKAAVKRPSVIRPAPRPEVKTEPGLQAVKRPEPDSAKTLPPTPVAALQQPPELVSPPTKPKPSAPRTGGPVAPSTRPSEAVTQPADLKPTLTERLGSGVHRPPKSSPRIEVGQVEELEAPVKPVTQPIGRPKTKPGAQAVLKQSVEDMLADVFLRVNDVYAKHSIEDAMAYLLDLALEKVACEAGSVLRADGASGDLSFAAARGPKARDLLAKHITIPAGKGIASFCASEGVSVAVSDVEKDPRFYSAVGEKVDYETKSLLCAPMMTHGRSFGCMQILNRKGGPSFLEHEVGVLAYIAHQAALYLNAQL